MIKHILIIVFITTGFLAFAQWSPTNGPGGGTINAFYKSDSLLFTASGGGIGGIFSSNDNGQHWNIKNKGLPLTTKATSIYGDEDYLYATYWLQGIFRSSDDGESWEAANNGISDYGLSMNTIYESGGVVYAGNYLEGVYVSINQGDSWTLKNNGLEGAARRILSIIEFYNVLYIGTPLGIYRSVDGGDNWEPSFDGIPQDKAYIFDLAHTSGFLYAAALDGVYRSSDTDLSWEKMSGDLFNTGLYTIDVDGDKIYTGSNGIMYISTDEALTWSQVGSAVTLYGYIYAIQGDNDGLICGVSVRGVYSYNPDTESWPQTNTGFINENVTAMMVDGEDLFAGTLRNDFGEIFKTSNNGTDWPMHNNGAWEGGYHCLLDAGEYYLAGTDGGFLYRSSDGAENWENIKYPEFPALYISSLCEKEGVVFGSSFGNTIDTYRSVDEGFTWNGCSVPGGGNVMALISTDDYIFSGRTDGAFRSEDLGISWTHTSEGMSETPFIKDFAVNDEYLFAAANDGLYRSDNNGDNWEKIYDPLVYNSISSIATYEDYLFMGTNETGFHYSEDNGETWETSNPEFFQDPYGIYPTVIAITVKGDSVYASYENFSVWVRPLPNITDVVEETTLNSGQDMNLNIYPNPVKGVSNVSYSLHSFALVSLKVYDILGKEVIIYPDVYQTAGRHRTELDLNHLEGGIYFVSLQTRGVINKRKIVVLK